MVLINNSGEKSISNIISRFKNKINLKVILSNSKNIGYLRNLGIRNSQAKAFYFIDSDCIIKSDSIKEALNSISKNPAVRGYIKFEGASKLCKLDAELRQKRYDSNPYFAYCPNLLIRKDLFDRVGLFDEKFRYGSDGEFAKRLVDLKVNVTYKPSIEIIHYGPKKDKKVISTWISYGEGRWRRYKNSDIKEKLNGMFKPILLDSKKRLSFNLVALSCLICRWYGWAKMAIKANFINSKEI